MMDLRALKLSQKELVCALQERPCTHCGACCRSFSIEIEPEDVRRQPQLLDYATAWDLIPPANKKLLYRAPFVILTDGKSCPFLGSDSLCRIYSSRPTICRKIVPTYLTCQVCRIEEHGLHLSQFIPEILITHHADPWTVAGIIFSINPEKFRELGITRTSMPVEIQLADLADPDYLKRYKKTKLK